MLRVGGDDVVLDVFPGVWFFAGESEAHPGVVDAVSAPSHVEPVCEVGDF